jgi:RNA polymerase sigma-70 factor (ECF subfamily)
MNDLPETRLSLLHAMLGRLRWEELVAIYAQGILDWARRWARSPLEAEQVAQDTLVRVWQHLPKYDPDRGRFRAWLHACARSAALDALRKGKRQAAAGGEVGQALLDQAEAPSEPDAWAADLEGLLDEAEPLGRAVEVVKARVPPNKWRAFVLTSLLDRSAEDAAGELGLSVAAVYKAGHQVRNELRRELAPEEREGQ